jgi:aryl-alcohol dehydrogenase-like predicted oxidoreductase
VTPSARYAKRIWHLRGDHWALAGAGRTARSDRAGDQDLPADGDWAERPPLSAYHIRRACEASLRRLKTDHIDFYQMHHVDRSTPWEEIWQVMEQLIREGKITYVGSSNFAGWDIATAQRTGASCNRPGLASASTKAAKAREADVAMCCIHERARWKLSISRPN